MINNGNNEYDSMKLMLSRMKEYNKSKNNQPMLIKEDYDSQDQGNNQLEKGSLIFGEKRLNEQERELTPEEIEEEQRMFNESVSPVVEFGQFQILEGNVEWSGKLVKENIAFTYSLDDTSGVYINAEMLQLSEDNMETIEKLRSYYVEWSERWGPEVSF
ncbi:hypothetical protein COB55_03825 [Candidatus Wolfebacteria bacterium]|nr:MAG: hypothetical protein COB55_03825 [Candidatus Wolfebacteria bacterium]